MQATYAACICLNMGKVWRGLGLSTLMSIPTFLLQPLTLVAMLLATFSFVCQTHLPFHLILYYLAPVFAWHRALSTPSSSRSFSSTSPLTRTHLGTAVGSLLVLVSIAASFHDRRWLSCGLLLIIVFLVKSSARGIADYIQFALKTYFKIPPFPSTPLLRHIISFHERHWLSLRLLLVITFVLKYSARG